MNTELTINFAAQAAQSLFAQIEPNIAAQVAPFIERLFTAFANGDTFIYITQEDADKLIHCTPIVGTDSSSPIVLQNRRLFLARNWQLERELAQQIQRLSANITPRQPENIADKLRTWFTDAGSRDQQAAAALALIKNFVLISGGPGTGKTTTVAKLLALLCDETLPRIALIAPTGKAAARLSEALRRAIAQIPMLPENVAAHLNALNGQTVHRLLGLTPPQMQPEFHATHRLPLDIVLVDEASMLDNHLFLQLLLALPDTCRVILLGDANQLPSVGAGAILAALSHQQEMQPETLAQLSALLPEREDWGTVSEQYARLTLSHRFDAESGIGCLANKVLSGCLDAWEAFAQFPEELKIKQNHIATLVHKLYVQHTDYWQAIETHNVQAAFAAQNRLIILTALRQDAQKVNETYRQLLQHHARVRPEASWYAGQMLMITRNAPTQKLYNGDVGIVMQPENFDGLVTCFADEQHGFRTVPLSRLPEHETAFAMTVHKSQGSEYDAVWFVAPQHSIASRALLYTAITRAKKQFSYWGNAASFQAACDNSETRRTALAMFL
ncbi:exodeoxyribonuclease V subunit alpha [Wielerella bovis]|uniref:exodeoxyribonuclease V subunit alpha n=1 Tax=Wielerella bovis TaxID=2917790 RepID=UPI002019C7B9|nr:exodeoxyribonuclease V subunit alpha [Wielerella bovis]MCG7657100.1 exodeoxyribonuclease V subunit alpha [Wielerella bovis]MCG7659323.1 exodeoxyribonuclease V subunit alpha [Wielerella bovis]